MNKISLLLQLCKEQLVDQLHIYQFPHMSRLGGAVVTYSPGTAMTQVRVLAAAGV